MRQPELLARKTLIGLQKGQLIDRILDLQRYIRFSTDTTFYANHVHETPYGSIYSQTLTAAQKLLGRLQNIPSSPDLVKSKGIRIHKSVADLEKKRASKVALLARNSPENVRIQKPHRPTTTNVKGVNFSPRNRKSYRKTTDVEKSVVKSDDGKTVYIYLTPKLIENETNRTKQHKKRGTNSSRMKKRIIPDSQRSDVTKTGKHKEFNKEQNHKDNTVKSNVEHDREVSDGPDASIAVIKAKMRRVASQRWKRAIRAIMALQNTSRSFKNYEGALPSSSFKRIKARLHLLKTLIHLTKDKENLNTNAQATLRKAVGNCNDASQEEKKSYKKIFQRAVRKAINANRLSVDKSKPHINNAYNKLKFKNAIKKVKLLRPLFRNVRPKPIAKKQRRQAVTVLDIQAMSQTLAPKQSMDLDMTNLIQVSKIAKDKDRYTTLVSKIKHVIQFWNTNIDIMRDNISAIESIDPGDHFRNHLIAAKNVMGEVHEKHTSQLDIWLEYLEFKIEMLSEFDGRVQRVFEGTINTVENEEHHQEQIKSELSKIFNENDFDDLFGETDGAFDTMLEMPFLVYDTFFVYQRWTRLWRLFIQKRAIDDLSQLQDVEEVFQISTLFQKLCHFQTGGYSGLMDQNVKMEEAHRKLSIVTIVEHYQFLNDLLKDQKCQRSKFQSADDLRKTLQDLWIGSNRDNLGNTSVSKTFPKQMDIDDFFVILHLLLNDR